MGEEITDEMRKKLNLLGASIDADFERSHGERQRSLHYDYEGNPIGLGDWAMLFEDVENRIVRQDKVGEYFVSTVWIGIDYRFIGDGPPLIFETMVFDADGSERDIARYSSEEEALKGHAAMVEGWKDA